MANYIQFIAPDGPTQYRDKPFLIGWALRTLHVPDPLLRNRPVEDIERTLRNRVPELDGARLLPILHISKEHESLHRCARMQSAIFWQKSPLIRGREITRDRRAACVVRAREFGPNEQHIVSISLIPDDIPDVFLSLILQLDIRHNEVPPRCCITVEREGTYLHEESMIRDCLTHHEVSQGDSLQDHRNDYDDEENTYQKS